ncbi:MAG TPA: DNA repair protein RadA [Bacillota bacterium]|jgi:DNA repair protein RadA/Sms|nr:DNA repair protein RadA [Bacillota bacterium]HQL36104.1 DNA repair protein RadA [Bacillota bacterium]
MAKVRTKFVCSECGSESPKWMGKCPECGQWNTLVEEVEQRDSQVQQSLAGVLSRPESLLDISDDIEERLGTGSNELDRVLGGGIVKGSLVLVGGDPGIGKSTLLLQIANNIGNKGKKVLYVSGEESTAQIKLRAFRMDIRSGNIFLVSENNTQNVDIYVRDMKPDILVVDSIQTMYNPVITSAPGSVSQVREATLGLMKIAKQDGIATFIVGHVTKQGSIAGPRVLEHMVDTVLYFEGETHMSYRVLRAVKNRFGSTNEIGIFEMGDKGLTEVVNPSEMLLSGRMEGATGSCVISAMEGTRAMLVEVQALLSHTGFGVPRRNATGVDYNRVALLMAVLEKRVGMQLGSSDSYVNVVGGIKLNEPAADLGIVAAIASSFRDREIDGSTVIIGEVGLAGEVRAVNFVEKRVNEAAKLGFKRCIIPENNLSRLNDKSGIEVLGVSNVNNMLDIVIGG